MVKTRVWRGGLAEVGRSKETPVTQAEPAAAPSPEQFSTTRFLPIEELFPEQHVGSRAQQEVATAPLEAPALKRAHADGANSHTWRWLPFARRQSMWRRAALAAIVAMMVLGARLVFSPGVSESAAKASASAPAPRGTPAASGPARAVEAARPNAEALAVRPHRPVHFAGDPQLASGLERAAVDALVAGDVQRARERYAELVRVAPEVAVYREALRILARPGQVE